MRIHQLCLALIALSFVLITLGGVVHNTESSLACPDWPLCFGEVLPEMKGGVAIEHSHRLLASLVGILSILLVVMVMRQRPIDTAMRKLAWAALALVVSQGLLGGITVLLRLPTLVSTAHLATSMLYFGLLIVMAFRSQPLWFRYGPRGADPIEAAPVSTVRRSLSWAIAAIYLQMILGALVRHTGSGASVGLGPDTLVVGFDLAKSQKDLWPSDGPGRLHMTHRFFALVVTGVVTWGAHNNFHFGRRFKDQGAMALGLTLVGMLGLQLFLGVASIWSYLGIPIVTAHLSVGTALLATALASRLHLGRAPLAQTSAAHDPLAAIVTSAGEPATTGGDRTSFRDKLLDAISLTKPRLALLVVFTTAAGMKLAPGELPLGQSLAAILWITLVVAAGTTLNMYAERDPDGRMERTRDRALPAGRLNPTIALIQGIVLATVGLAGLSLWVNPMTAFLAALSLLIYLGVYTPLKPRSVTAVYVGAIPGATPIVMGWTAVTGSLDAQALALFALMFIWQIPHFIAISLYRREEYEAAGFKILPLVYGERASLWHMLGTSIGLAVATVVPSWLGLGGPLYTGVAILMGLAILLATARGLLPNRPDGWARRYFLGTLVYLPIVLGVLVFDVSRG